MTTIDKQEIAEAYEDVRNDESPTMCIQFAVVRISETATRVPQDGSLTCTCSQCTFTVPKREEPGWVQVLAHHVTN
ncbi:hypothetical protein BaRGS_00014973 [Batillaria attramentaria]|uniref:Uncharacterized protein n=1 Tax=Batillaria attramentaria TaxID=370345 RepID=A0ABD0L341_9CAEN